MLFHRLSCVSWDFIALFSVYFKLILIKEDNEELSFIMQITQRRKKLISDGIDKQNFVKKNSDNEIISGSKYVEISPSCKESFFLRFTKTGFLLLNSYKTVTEVIIALLALVEWHVYCHFFPYLETKTIARDLNQSDFRKSMKCQSKLNVGARRDIRMRFRRRDQ